MAKKEEGPNQVGRQYLLNDRIGRRNYAKRGMRRRVVPQTYMEKEDAPENWVSTVFERDRRHSEQQSPPIDHHRYWYT